MTEEMEKKEAPKIRVYYDRDQVRKDLTSYNADLSIDFTRQPGLYAYYASLLAQAETQYDQLDHGCDVLEAKLETYYREELSKGPDRVTEGQIKAKVKVDSRLIQARRLLREAREQVAMLKGACEGFKQRKDMLLQLGFREREEMKDQPRVMQKSLKETRDGRVRDLSNIEPID